jgi:hypothetical protein
LTDRPAWRREDCWCIAGLVVVTIIPYWQLATFDFVWLDDKQYVTESALVQQGLNPVWPIRRGKPVDVAAPRERRPSPSQ